MRACLLLLAPLLLAACGGSSVNSTATPTEPDADAAWAALEARPLNLPDIRINECPVAAAHELSPAFAAGIGDGPIYPVGLTDEAQFVHFPEGGEWPGHKVLWVVAPGFQGEGLIRGRRIDGDGEVRFGSELVPETEMRIDSGAERRTGWFENPSYTRVKEPGCYGYQVDTADFSYSITFSASVEG